MKKNSLLFLALALIAGGLAYAKSRPADKITINSDSQSPTEMINEASKFAAAIESGKPYSCQMTSDDASMTYQLKAGKMYMTTNTPEYSGYMINDTEYIYSWSDQSDQGSKMRMPTEEEVETMTEDLPDASDTPSFASESDYQAYQDQGYTITCEQADINDSLFTPPSNITFIDPTAMMEGLTGGSGELDMEKLQEMAKEYQEN